MGCLLILLGAMGFAVWANQKVKKEKDNPGGRSWERW